ncbi:DUF1444 domain-containing protein [Shouchella lonarensis]|uniref:Uncharacterized protein YtpQ, UPF0354 family n=1 Tax=Shouchella lonarensis TaxID=1464122 RepID=A0A1G6GGP7_9BACI|nr:DUF1444 domain-containing protein [Shouchella lonarensis]SDB81188.1 Uncharacterized protein YtpQ, UPF0354 family [Shouchella lonarensis]
MDLQALRHKIISTLERDDWTFSYDHKEATLRIEDTTSKKGVTLSLKPLLAKWERKEYAALDEAIRYVRVGLQAMVEKVTLIENEKHIFPVIRAASFPTETKDGKKLVTAPHTAETQIFYALDCGQTYTLIDEDQLKESELSAAALKEMALFNVRTLPQPVREDRVAGNTFYFLSANDGYDASRILDQSFVQKMTEQVEGELAVAIPHQDALIFADIKNDTGYDVLAQMTLQFFMQGRVPVTALPFMVTAGELEPVFIMARKKQ